MGELEQERERESRMDGYWLCRCYLISKLCDTVCGREGGESAEIWYMILLFLIHLVRAFHTLCVSLGHRLGA